MTNDRELDEILAELGREHRAIGAPEWLEPVLFAAADQGKPAMGRPRVRLVWGLAAAAMVLAVVATAGVLWETRGGHRPQSQQVQSVPEPQLRPEPIVPSTSITVPRSVALKAGPVRRARRDSGRESSAKQQAWNSLDEFVALPVSEGLPPAAELSVVRMKLSGSDLQQYGLQAPLDAAAQTLLAEFAVGEDGLPRAIRIIR
jgi:hypothetical protein